GGQPPDRRQELEEEDGTGGAQDDVLEDAVGRRRVLDVVREEVGARDPEGDAGDREEPVARFHFQDHEGRRDDQDQDADDRRADYLGTEESEGDEDDRDHAQEQGPMEEIEDERDDSDQDEEPVDGRIAEETQESVVERLAERRYRDAAQTDVREESIEGLGLAGDEPDGGRLVGSI